LDDIIIIIEKKLPEGVKVGHVKGHPHEFDLCYPLVIIEDLLLKYIIKS